MRYVRIFRKKIEDRTRYWAAVSDETEDGERIDANMTLRMSQKAAAVFADNSTKTKTDGIKTGVFEITDCWLKAVRAKDGNFAVLFVNLMKPEEQKTKQKKLEDD